MTRHDDQWLERALRAAEPHLADDGFTQRVLAALPPAPAPRATRLDWVVPAAVALGSAVVASQFPLAPFLDLAEVALRQVQLSWLGAAVMIACMAGALLAEPLRRVL
ncbi:MAG: hypothetical protein IPF57_20710 [Gammaproteobacteria bacterium]|jgi:hypothetical protein|nr:hypothetical protein [Gammaproteobacteria bacterium]MBK9469541.1 hypothetical protein [Gammaproteobacteria bacterium]